MADLRELLREIPRPTERRYRVRGFQVVTLPRVIALSLVALYVLRQVAEVHAHSGPGRLLLELFGYLAAPLTFVVLFLALFAIFYARNRRLATMLRENNEGLVLAASNRVPEARALYERLARRGRRSRTHHALFVGNCGVVALLEGDPGRARVLMAEALRRGGFATGTSAAGGYFAATLAKSYALEGDLRRATAWRELATGLLPAHRRAVLLIVDATLLVRSGHASAAASAIAGAWMGAEGELAAHDRRALRALQAFALSLAGRDVERDVALAGLYPPMAGLLEHLCVAWPELRSFLAASGAVRAA